MSKSKEVKTIVWNRVDNLVWDFVKPFQRIRNRVENAMWTRLRVRSQVMEVLRND